MSFTVEENRGSRISARRNAWPCSLPWLPSLSATTSCVLNASRMPAIGSIGTAGVGLCAHNTIASADPNLIDLSTPGAPEHGGCGRRHDGAQDVLPRSRDGA